jgi:hypothetical protein
MLRFDANAISCSLILVGASEGVLSVADLETDLTSSWEDFQISEGAYGAYGACRHRREFFGNEIWLGAYGAYGAYVDEVN